MSVVRSACTGDRDAVAPPAWNDSRQIRDRPPAPRAHGAPVLTVNSAAALIGRSFPQTNAAIQRLVDAGVLAQVNVGRRNRAFEAGDAIRAFMDLERQLASPLGDTVVSPPTTFRGDDKYGNIVTSTMWRTQTSLNFRTFMRTTSPSLFRVAAPHNRAQESMCRSA